MQHLYVIHGKKLCKKYWLIFIKVYRDMGPTVESLSSIGQEHLNHLDFSMCGFNFNPTLFLLEGILTPQYPPRKPSVDGLWEKKHFGFGYIFAELVIVEWLDFLNYWLKVIFLVYQSKLFRSSKNAEKFFLSRSEKKVKICLYVFVL